MRKVVIVLFVFFILFGVCGCDVFQDSHYIPNGKYYYDDDTYMKINIVISVLLLCVTRFPTMAGDIDLKQEYRKLDDAISKTEQLELFA